MKKGPPDGDPIDAELPGVHADPQVVGSSGGRHGQARRLAGHSAWTLVMRLPDAACAGDTFTRDALAHRAVLKTFPAVNCCRPSDAQQRSETKKGPRLLTGALSVAESAHRAGPGIERVSRPTEGTPHVLAAFH